MSKISSDDLIQGLDTDDVFDIIVHNQPVRGEDPFSGTENCRFSLSKSELTHSEMLNVMANDCKSEHEIHIDLSDTLPSPITRYAIHKCMAFLKMVKSYPMVSPERPLRSKDLKSEWANTFKDVSEENLSKYDKVLLVDAMIEFIDQVFVDGRNTCEKLYEVMLSANYLGVKQLVVLCATKIAQIIRKEKMSDLQNILSAKPATNSSSSSSSSTF